MPDDSHPFDYEAVLVACVAGDRQALHRLYQNDGRYLLGVALRILRHRALAEDVLHDAFVSIWTRAVSFDPQRGAAKGWIYSVVRHAALNHVRASQRETLLGDDLDQLVDEHPGDDDAGSHAMQGHAALGKLDDCLSHLSDNKRASIVYAYVDGCTHGEIAARLQAPLGSVKAWIKRGLAALRECMT